MILLYVAMSHITLQRAMFYSILLQLFSITLFYVFNKCYVMLCCSLLHYIFWA